jgi:hypothetical protein
MAWYLSLHRLDVLPGRKELIFFQLQPWISTNATSMSLSSLVHRLISYKDIGSLKPTKNLPGPLQHLNTHLVPEG